MRHTRYLLPLLMLSNPAQAARPPAGYRATVSANRVTICPELRNDRACPQPEGMLRQNTATSETVQLPQNCTNRRVDPDSVGRDVHTGACYVDECVPPGTYRYGYASPLTCVGSTTFFYAEITVTAELPRDCRGSGGGQPTAIKRAPWGASPYVCVGGCGCDVVQLPEVTWGLILLLIAICSLYVTSRTGHRAG